MYIFGLTKPNLLAPSLVFSGFHVRSSVLIPTYGVSLYCPAHFLFHFFVFVSGKIHFDRHVNHDSSNNLLIN